MLDSQSSAQMAASCTCDLLRFLLLSHSRSVLCLPPESLSYCFCQRCDELSLDEDDTSVFNCRLNESTQLYKCNAKNVRHLA
jgi:hypothetical protein